MPNYKGQNFRGGYRGQYRNDYFGRGRSVLEKENIQVILKGLIKVVVDQDQIWEPVLIGIGWDVLYVGSMTIWSKTAWIYQIQGEAVRTDTTHV